MNTIKLVRFYDGVDGLKTGYTSDAGYCLTATAKKNGMRLIAVVMGEPDSKTRNAEVTQMLDYGFAQYEVEKVLSTDSILAEKKVEKGKDEFAKIVPTENISILHKKIDGKKNVTYELHIDKLKAPLKIGDIVGTIDVLDGDSIIKTVNLTVKEQVDKINIFENLYRNFANIVLGNF